MGPRVPFAPALLTLSLFTYFFISFWLFNLLYLTCVMVNKAVKKKKKKKFLSGNIVKNHALFPV